MPRPHRKERLSELLWRELNSIIGFELDDPRIGEIEVSRVEVTDDLQVAHIYIMPLGEHLNAKAKDEQILRGLEAARGFIRSQIANRVQLRKAPELVFRIDRGTLYAEQIDALLEHIEYSPEFLAEDGAAAPSPQAPSVS